ncbi:hypothetical protein HUU53_03170 [Candidatus Micrarchaeota archaeon]|nr:hypothetical protein [Candidatus Micrarchaeota archaeon]
MMGKTCKIVLSVLATAAGLSLAGVSWGWFNTNTGLMYAGVLFVLYGLGKLVHSMHMCPMCNSMHCDCCVEEMPKKKK